MGAEQSGEYGDRDVENALRELLAASGIESPGQHLQNLQPIVVERTRSKIRQRALDLLDADINFDDDIYSPPGTFPDGWQED